MTNTVGQRLKAAREKAGISQRELARRTGLSQQLISKLENGLIESTTEVFAFAGSLGINPRWLATGQGVPEPKTGEDPGIVAHVPLVSWVAAGSWREVADPYPVGEGEKLIPVTQKVGPNAYALRVQGDSMEPRFPNGSIIVVDPAVEPHSGSYVVVRLDDAELATFKQLAINGGEHYLKPLNPAYPVLKIEENATLCGVVRQMVMEFD